MHRYRGGQGQGPSGPLHGVAGGGKCVVMTFLKYPLPSLSRFELWPGPVEGGPTVSGGGAGGNGYRFARKPFIGVL